MIRQSASRRGELLEQTLLALKRRIRGAERAAFATDDPETFDGRLDRHVLERSDATGEEIIDGARRAHDAEHRVQVRRAEVGIEHHDIRAETSERNGEVRGHQRFADASFSTTDRDGAADARRTIHIRCIAQIRRRLSGANATHELTPRVLVRTVEPKRPHDERVRPVATRATVDDVREHIDRRLAMKHERYEPVLRQRLRSDE